MIPESNTSASGLEVYKDEEPNKLVFTCGGKLLVLDMTFLINPSSEIADDSPIILDSLHITHASAAGDETQAQSAAAQATADHLPILLSELIKSIIQATLTDNAVPDGRLIALLWKRYRSHLKYLVFLDALAASGSTHGVRWLREAGNIAEHVGALTGDELKGLSPYVISLANRNGPLILVCTDPLRPSLQSLMTCCVVAIRCLCRISSARPFPSSSLSLLDSIYRSQGCRTSQRTLLRRMTAATVL